MPLMLCSIPQNTDKAAVFPILLLVVALILTYVHENHETSKRNASSKSILPHCELAVIMQNSNSETTKTRKKGPKLICIKLQIKHLL